MPDKKINKNNGFALISLILVMAIIAILFALYYKKSNNGKPSAAQIGQKAIEQTKQNNAALEQQNLDIQNELNSINPPEQAGHSAIDQAKNAAKLQNQSGANSAGQ